MSEIADRYRRLGDAFASKVEQVTAAQWDSPSPCDGWTARDIVSHIVDVHGLFFRLVGRTIERTISVDDDPVGALREAERAMQADLDDPVRACAEFDGFFGRSTFEAAVDRFVCFDLTIHGWDLSRAVGLDDTISPAEIARVRRDAESFGETLHQSGVCGPALDVNADADDQTKLLALLGRRA
jgi:uncharacterized protein (TIGR03086 family)